MTSTRPEPVTARVLDPLAPAPGGCYTDELVRVVRRERDRRPSVVSTPHFRLHRDGRRIEVSHRLCPDELDNDLAGLLVDELFTPGWLSGNDIFERVFTGVVRSTVCDPLLAWTTFYGNTLARLRRAWSRPGSAPRPDSLIERIAPVYDRALRLVPDGRVLDLGSCFGFLPLLLARRPRNAVTATDLAPGSMRLLASVACDREVRVETLVCEASRVPLPDESADTVTVIHLFEHLEPGHADDVLAEAMRLAASRVVVAVPFEDEPSAVYGHVRCFDLATLNSLGARSGWHHTVSEFHGGWLVLDRTGK
jgi:SAM-dependent methyltransferase